jgi:hypothetical protein
MKLCCEVPSLAEEGLVCVPLYIKCKQNRKTKARPNIQRASREK